MLPIKSGDCIAISTPRTCPNHLKTLRSAHPGAGSAAGALRARDAASDVITRYSSRESVFYYRVYSTAVLLVSGFRASAVLCIIRIILYYVLYYIMYCWTLLRVAIDFNVIG